MELAAELRAGYARVLGTDPEHVALTGSTTDGVNTILAGLELGAGRRDHHLRRGAPRPARAARPRPPDPRRRRCASCRSPSCRARSTPRTKLIACSHVSWVGGQVADVAALHATGVPVLLDAAQSIGAVPADVEELGVRLLRRLRPEVAVRPGGQRLPVRPRRTGSTSSRSPGRATARSPVPSTRSSSRPPRAPSASTTASRPGCAAPGRWPRCRCSRPPAGSGCTSAPPTPRRRARRPARRARRRRRAPRPLDARLLAGRGPGRDRRAARRARGSSCGASRPRAWCGRRSGRGRARRNSRGWPTLAV